MKRLKIFAIVLISVLLILLIGNTAFGTVSGTVLNGSKTIGTKEASYASNGTVYVKNTEYVFDKAKNLYCIQPGQELGSELYYTKASTVTIRGNKTKVTDKNGTVIFDGTNSYSNRIAAYIYLDTIDIGESKDIDTYGDGGTNQAMGYGYAWWSLGQIGIWHDWDSWKNAFADTDKSWISEYIGGWYGMPNNFYDAEASNIWYSFTAGTSKMIKMASENNYSVSFDVLTCGSNQRLILVRPEEEVEPIDIKVTKTWNDNSNQDGKRPTSVTIKLYENGTETNKSITLNTGNNWKGTFSDLPKTDSNGDEIKYTVKESVVPSGYTSSISGDMKSGYIITNTHTPEKVKFKINKTWDDNDNRDGIRPSSITVGFYKGDTKISTITLNSSNDWKFETEEYYKYSGGSEITYTFKESSVTGYTTKTPLKIKLSTSNNVTTYQVTIRNQHTLERINIPVQKIWDDDNNRDVKRPTSIGVKLLKNNNIIGTLTLNESNGWKGEFKNLYKYENGQEVNYTIREVSVEGYTSKLTGNKTSGFTITNTHNPETINIPVQKIWNDEDDLDEYRPDSIQIQLLANGAVTKTATLKASNGWKYTFSNLYKYEAGKEIAYTIKEVSATKYESKITGDLKSGYTITNTHEPHYDGYIEISGKVWLDKKDGKANDINGKLDDGESGLGGIKVTLKDANGNQFDATSTAVTSEKGTYTIKVNYDNSKKVYKQYKSQETVKENLKEAYVEFAYDGLKYTTVATAKIGANTSKAKENENTRKTLDSTYSTVTSSTVNPDTYNISASTKNVISFKDYEDTTTTKNEEKIKYCNGDGTYIRTNPNGAHKNILKGTNDELACKKGSGHQIKTYEVEVEVIQNVNLGLFEREQPNVAIFSDLSKVEVTMNGQKYTYLYNVRSNDNINNVGLKAKFQNKDTYTYRRPVNPADIAYIQETANQNAMSVVVTYNVKVANLSETLTTTINSINNYYDNRYELITAGWKSSKGEQFNKATKNGLNITLKPQTESSEIQLTYKVNIDAIKGLLKEEATLNNAVEIASYSTIYGEKTLYAEQRTHETEQKNGNQGRSGNPYAGYDHNLRPGNLIPESRLFINQEGRLEIKKQENDEDIAPSFVLCKDDEKVLSGTVWEDLDVRENDERVGNGYYDSEEKQVQNVKVELYELVTNSDGSTSSQLAKLYKIDEDNKYVSSDSIVYTDANGVYSFDGVVTGEYFIKFTYGNKTNSTEEGEEVLKEATTMDGKFTTVNARNYKSTIITDPIIKNIFGKDYEEFSEEEKMWHITHEDGYSVAVDNMLDRLKIEDLQYSNFDTPLNMVSYSKPFKTQVEFETTGQSQVKMEDRSVENGVININGNIETSNELNKLDFGIAERPREDLFVQKTITNLKVSLANGQVLIEGNPSEGLNYVKAIGFKQNVTTGEEARKAIEKQLYIEMDAELIQGSTLQLDYQVKLVNNNEIDYDYGNSEDYTDIVNEKDGKNKYDSFITKNSKANYYYYGNNSGLSEMKSTIEFVDYMSNNVIFTDSTQWTTVDKTELNGLVDRNVVNVIEGEKYKILRSVSGKSITLERNEDIEMKMSVSKLLSSGNNDDNVYDNHVEIIKIDGKTARTIQESRQGEQIEKSYKPGDYVPSANSEREQDSDRVKAIITPPTGITNYITIYVIAGLIGLTVIAISILVIKKKVLIK